MIELFAVLVVLNLADAWTTYRILSSGGSERFILLRRLIPALGLVPALVIGKAAMLGLLYSCLSQTPDWMLIGACLVYVAILVNNLRVIDAEDL